MTALEPPSVVFDGRDRCWTRTSRNRYMNAGFEKARTLTQLDAEFPPLRYRPMVTITPADIERWVDASW